MPTAAAAATIVGVRAGELAGHAHGVLDTGDIERVHDMRVATRRLRAALETFEVCFPKKAYASALAEVKELADALGERRDRDVTIDSLERFAAELAAPDRPGVESLVGALRREQQEANEELAPYVTGERVAELRERMERLADSALEKVEPEEEPEDAPPPERVRPVSRSTLPRSPPRQPATAPGRQQRRRRGGLVKARPVKKLDPVGPLKENAARMVLVRLDELRSLAPDALEPDASGEQHDLRIAAKRLRYVLETTGFCFGAPAREARKRARDLQSLLGELHDSDLMLPRIERHLAELRASDAAAVRARAADAPDLDPELAARAPHRTSYRGLEVLAVFMEARRNLLFDRFTEFWERQRSAGIWGRLEEVAKDALREAKERRRAEKRAREAEEELEAAEEARRAAAERARKAADDLARAEQEARGTLS